MPAAHVNPRPRPRQTPPGQITTPGIRAAGRPKIKKRMHKRRRILAAASILFSLTAATVCVLLFVKPKIALNGSDEMEVEVFQEFSDPGCKASFLFINLTNKIEYEEDPPVSKTGIYEKEYNLACLGREYSICRTIRVVDKTPPVIELNGELEMTLSSIDFFVEDGYTASDNYDGDLTDAVSVSKEYDTDAAAYIITYTVEDAGGNTSQAQRRIKVQDVVPPVLTLLGDADIYTHAARFSDPGYSASDDLDGDITGMVAVETDYKPCTVGDFTFAYSVSDSSGNTVSAERRIHVTDQTPPKLSLAGSKSVKMTVGNAFADPGATASDDFDGNLSDKITVAGEVDCNTIGTYTITYSVEDAAGNPAQMTRTVVVVPAAVVLDVPYIDQRSKYPNGCESVCMVMALRYAGIDISVDDFIENYLDMCELPYYDDNGKRWGYSPWDYFVGDPRKSTGLCCYAPVIKKACDKFTPSYGHTAQIVNGATLASLCNNYVDNGKPVVVWVTMQMKAPYLNGKQWNVIGTNTVFKWTSPMHCMLLTGYDENYYYFNDPLSGKNVKYAKSKSEAAFKGMFSQAIVLS